MLQPLRVIGLTLVLAAVLTAAASGDPTRRLVVFTQPDASDVERDFARHDLPEITRLAEEMGLELIVRDARDGAPDEITITPLLVHQDHRGRAIYQGRYSTLDRVRNFLRTARFVAPSDAPLERTKTHIARLGRAVVAVPVKITPLTGAVPADFDQAAFAREMGEHLAAGFLELRAVEHIALRRGDRRFYLDLHPYRDDAGRLFIATEAYSQFHCKKPIDSRLDQPFEGTWDDRADLLARVGSMMEWTILDSTEWTDFGDGFTPVATEVSTKTWAELGLPNPPEPDASEAMSNVDITLPTAWRVAADPPPAVLFRFLPPLDTYAGEASSLAGAMRLTDPDDLRTATGSFTVAVASVTMGEPDLDAHIASGPMLDRTTHPESSFTIDRIDTDAASLAFGTLTNAVMTGTFRMKDVPLTLTVRADFEPIVAEDGRPRLVLSASFRIRLRETFGIIGPDGPTPSNDTLEYEVFVTLEPDAAASGGDASSTDE